MKKILTFLVIFLTVGIANAQTEAETLDWLNTKKTSFKYFLPPDINRVSEKWDDLVFHKDFISCKLNNKTINIRYNEIKEIFQTKNVPLTDDGYYVITIKTSQGISLDF